MDDDEIFRTSVRQSLERAYSITEAASVAEFEARFQPYTYDLVILDMRLDKDREGLEVLREIQQWDENQPVIMASAYGDSDSVVEAAEGGALMFLHKTEFTPQLTMRLVEAVLQQARARRHLAALRSRITATDPVELTGLDPSMRQVGALIRQASEEPDSLVVVAGEFGTGHEQVAAAIHDRSRRRSSGPLSLSGSVAASPEEAKVELFGYFARGASRRKGLLERAHSGVLFFGGFHVLPAAIQTEIGEALHDGHIRVPGGEKVIPIDFQLVVGVAPGHGRKVARVLREAAQREQAIEIFLPPLRERKDDIPLLATYILEGARRRHGLSARSFSRDALQAIERQTWEGNVKELRSVVELAAVRASLASSDEVRADHLPFASSPGTVATGEPRWDYKEVVAAAELGIVSLAVDRGVTNKTQMATMLHYNDRFALGRRVRKAFEEFPHLTEEFPKVAGFFGIVGPTGEQA